MIPPDFYVATSRQFEDSPSVIQSHGQGSEWGPSRVAPPFILLSPSVQEQQVWGFPGGPNQHPSHTFLETPNSHYSDLHVPDTEPYSTLVNQDQVNLDPVCAECQPLVFLDSNSSFDSNISDSAPTFLNPIQDDVPRIFPGLEDGLGFVLTDYPAMDNVPQASDGVPGYSTSSTFAPPPTSSLGQYTEASFQMADSYAFHSVGTSPPDWGSSQPVAHVFVESPSAFNFADPTAGIDDPSYPQEIPQEIDYEAVQSLSYTASPRFDQQSMLSERYVVSCEWKDGDGQVCGEVFIPASLSEHLSTHGIKNKFREYPMKCNWASCKLKREIKRESIVRHIREVHLRLKRPSKRVQDP